MLLSLKGNSMQKLLSIIMPVYNMEEFLDISIPSVLNQDYKNIELLLINDGSTDKSLEICQKYSKSDTRVQIINLEHKGIASARNAGLKAVKGEYVTFVDSDDWVERDIYTYLISVLDHTDVDFAECGYYTVLDDRIEYDQDKKEAYYDRKEALNAFLYAFGSVDWLLWNKVYRRDIVQNIVFDTEMAEDMLFNLEVIKKGNRFFASNIPKYNWNRKSYISASRKPINANHLEQIKCFCALENAALEEGLVELADKSYARVCQRILSYSARTQKAKFYDYKKYLCLWKKFARKNFIKTLKCKSLNTFVKINYAMYCVVPFAMNIINIRLVRNI